MHGMTKSGNLSSYGLKDRFIESEFIKYQFQVYIYMKYAPDGTKHFVLSHFYDFVYWYTP